MTTVARNWAAELGFKKGSSLLSPLEFVNANPHCLLAIGGIIRACQEERNFALAAGYMVWLHTLRAVTNSDLRSLAQEMWEELQRGFPHVNESYAAIMAIPGVDLPLSVWSEDYMNVPIIPTT
jgi:hypothetical protein